MWVCCVILTILVGACFTIFNDDNQSSTCPVAIDPRTQLIAAPKMEVMLEKKSTLKISSSSVLTEVDASFWIFPCK